MRDLLYRTDDWLFERYPRTVEMWWGRDQRIAHVDALGEPVFAGPGLVVEYDGSYFHSKPERRKTDIEKTEALVNAVLLVARIREQSSVTRLHPFMSDEPSVFMVDVDAKRWRDEIPSAVQQITNWASVHSSTRNVPVSDAVRVSDGFTRLGVGARRPSVPHRPLAGIQPQRARGTGVDAAILKKSAKMTGEK